jgi:hypothetical protein
MPGYGATNELFGITKKLESTATTIHLVASKGERHLATIPLCRQGVYSDISNLEYQIQRQNRDQSDKDDLFATMSTIATVPMPPKWVSYWFAFTTVIVLWGGSGLWLSLLIAR